MNVTRPLMEFHVSAASRRAHNFDEGLFASSGRVVFANFASARRFAQALNARNPQRGARAGDVNAMGLIDEVLHALIQEYRVRHKPNLWQEAFSKLEGSFGVGRVQVALEAFARDFPPLAVYQGRVTLEAYLNGSTNGVPNREVLLEEMLLLWLENQNPAFAPYQDLFDDDFLRQNTVYASLISSVEQYLEAQEPFAAAGGLTLWKVLRLPAMAHPGSLEAQLRLLLERFGGAFNASRFADVFAAIRRRLLGSLDLITEENRFFEALNDAREGRGGFVGGFAGDARVQRVTPDMLEYEPEAFTQDQSWMPRLVLIAKNAFVWLDQLRKIHGVHVRTLADVPDAELERLKSWGVTGLWLIGLWERSHASKEIKHRMGNPDAVASAYSLYDYTIADALGGEAALEQLQARAWQYGIRMASDMVPNHVGIDGKWVIEHPEWFLQTSEPPFPGYTFGSQDLSEDSRVGIFLEDHYYDHSDAAVVFKRLDRRTGQASYVYHGNDGSGLPWNDTAQLNYLSPAVREAVIQTILRVARQFPVIRFDAAMTLAKRHIKRLWFPEPGSGEGIASRSEHGLTREQFDALMPQEFWREVVDRAAVEAPDTLLLAEAFWMMEGYFVRSLGMHRVYNSAFMNMLRDEKNGEYRAILRETAAFEPEILKRYVNFLNNPDEKTAVEQFGKGDKYFGIMTLCATLPGLPMIGHGQIEGYTEKYGMEYQRAYFDERPDEGLIAHHASQIFPLLKKRALFAETDQFVMYNFTNDHHVNENVYAYSNARGGERALVLYNNSNHFATGIIKDGQGAKRASSLTQGLGLTGQDGYYAIYRDLVSNLEFIRSSRALQDGMRVELGAYGRSVMLDWREVFDTDGRYARINRMLEGRGVESIEAATLELYLERILTPWSALVNASTANRLLEASPVLYGELEARAKALADGVEAHTGKDLEGGKYASRVRGALQDLALANTTQALEVLGVIVTGELGTLTNNEARGLLDEWLLSRQLERAFKDTGLSAWDAARAVARVKLLVSQRANLNLVSDQVLDLWTTDLDAPGALGLNRYDGVTYVNAEQLEAVVATAKLLSSKPKHVDAVLKTVSSAGYRVEVRESGNRESGKAKSARVPAKPKAQKGSDRLETISEPSAAVQKNTRRATKTDAAVSEKPKTSSKTKTASSRAKPLEVAESPIESGVETPAPIVAKPKSPAVTARKGATRASTATPAKTPTETTPASKTTKPSSKKPTSEPTPKTPSKTAAKPKPTPVTRDDLTVINGIGPKVASVLEAGGILSYAQLAKAKDADLKAMLEAAGIKLFKNLETWAGQAKALTGEAGSKTKRTKR
jgi:predicted flap endonuclease-1-like 5' DNA nuclease/glycosidase